MLCNSPCQGSASARRYARLAPIRPGRLPARGNGCSAARRLCARPCIAGVDGTCGPGGIRQIRPLLLHRRAADCLPDAPAGPIALLTIQACLADLADAGKAALLEKLGHCADARDILVLPGMSGWQAGRHAEAWSQLVRGTGSASRLLGGSVCPMAGRRRVSGVWREVL
jgi:hypothetical protein